MLVKDLLEILNKTVEVHPEALEAQAWATSHEVGHKFQIDDVIYKTRKGQPPRLLFEG